MSDETRLREQIAFWARSIFARGLTSGSSGNISARLDDGWLVTPTNCSLGALRTEEIVRVDASWAVLDGGTPSKEAPLHAAVYASRPATAAVVHLHSPYAVAVSCLEEVEADDVLPPLTPYYVMRVGRLPLARYRPPGDSGALDDIRELATESHAVLLANHGSLVAGTSLEAAVFAAEELEETARLFLLLAGRRARPLAPESVAELRELFPS
jgi:3-dehydro-4-phosphotetronate decarboxylase